MTDQSKGPAADLARAAPTDGSPPTISNDPTRTPRSRWTLWRKIKWTVRGTFLILLVGVFVLGCDSCFYFPSKKIHLMPSDLHVEYEDVWITTSDKVKLHGWFLPAMTTAASRSSASGLAPTVVHFHGNAENITNHLPLVAWLPWHGYNVLLFDYRGYGQSEGKVTRKGTILDGMAAVDYVLTRPDVDPARVYAFGQSLGGAVATVVTAERPQVAGLVADCTFGSYRHIGSAHLRKLLRFKGLSDAVASALLSGDYEPIDYVKRISPRPLLVIVSDEDEICFADCGRELFEAASEPKNLISLSRGAHLEGVFDNVDEVQTRLIQFLAGAGSP